MISATLITLLTLAAAAPAPQSFGLVTIHSGSQYQYSAVKVDADGHFTVESDASDLSLSLDDGKLTADGKSVSVTNNQPLVGKFSSDHFTIDNGHLAWLGSESFYVCDNKQVYYGRFGVPEGCSNPVGVALRTV